MGRIIGNHHQFPRTFTRYSKTSSHPPTIHRSAHSWQFPCILLSKFLVLLCLSLQNRVQINRQHTFSLVVVACQAYKTIQLQSWSGLACLDDAMAWPGLGNTVAIEFSENAITTTKLYGISAAGNEFENRKVLTSRCCRLLLLILNILWPTNRKPPPPSTTGKRAPRRKFS